MRFGLSTLVKCTTSKVQSQVTSRNRKCQAEKGDLGGRSGSPPRPVGWSPSKSGSHLPFVCAVSGTSSFSGNSRTSRHTHSWSSLVTGLQVACRDPAGTYSGGGDPYAGDTAGQKEVSNQCPWSHFVTSREDFTGSQDSESAYPHIHSCRTVTRTVTRVGRPGGLRAGCKCGCSFLSPGKSFLCRPTCIETEI